MAMDAVMNGFNVAVQGSAPCPTSGAQTPSFNWSYLFEYKSDTYFDSVSDQCAVIASDPTCKLRNEKVDGFIETVRNYNRTGLKPLPSTKKFTGAVGNMDVAREWWQIDREYTCDAGKTWDLSGVKERFETINSSAVRNNNTLNYSDKRISGSGWSTSANSITLPEGETYSECLKSCKIKRPRLDTQISITGIPSMNRNDQNTFDFFYFACEDDVTCPAAPGDTIVAGCSCLNEFGQASSVLQLMRTGSGDSICSDGTPKQL